MLEVRGARGRTGEEIGREMCAMFSVGFILLTSPSSTPVLEQPLPPVLSQLVSVFSRHLKEQTSTGDEIDKSSDSGMKKVRQETAAQRQVRERGEVCGICDVRCLSGLLQAVGDVSAQIQRDAQRVGYLKQENTEVCARPLRGGRQLLSWPSLLHCRS